MSHALNFAEIEGQEAELLPARTVLSTFGSGYGGHGGDGGDFNFGGHGFGGHGGDALAVVAENHNKSLSFFGFGDTVQENVAIAEAGDGGDGYGGDVHANGGDGGDGGHGHGGHGHGGHGVDKLK